jgi:LPS-assembly protein
MHVTRLPSFGLLMLLVLAGDSYGAGLGLKLDRTLGAADATGNERLPIFVDADEIQGRQESDVEARGNARLRTREKSLSADWLLYRSKDDEVEAEGNVRLEQAGNVFEGTRLKLNLETEQGYLKQPVYRLSELGARGDANEFIFVGENRYRVDQGRYTTCGPGRDDWFIRARDLDLDKNTNIGTARDASVVFMNTPILYTPWMDFPLSRDRKSGFLSPTIATGGKSGAEFSIPYYWNIAPNRDATITPHILSKRGVMVGGEFRYLDPTYNGELRVEMLPNDQVADRDRYAAFARHTHIAGPWTFLVNVQKVSDDNYFRDLSTQIQATSRTLLPREAHAIRGGALGQTGNWSLVGHVQRWQTLQDPQSPIGVPYDRLPSLTLVTNNYDIAGTDINFTGTYVDFRHPTQVNGSRLVAYPSVSLPLQTSYAFLTPKIGVHYTRYDLSAHQVPTLADQPTRSLPIFSTEGGLVFERDASFGGTKYLQTLEPRLMYVYIPYRDQSRLPNFESGVADINFASIFSENQFSGSDRINDANQLTLGVTSRLLDPNTGIEQIRVGVAQRFYFKDQQVTIPGYPVRTSTSSDILAAISGRFTRNLIGEAAVQYDDEFSQSQKLALGARYQPDVGKVLNVGYRFTRNVLENFDVSAQWPLGNRWSGVGRVNYSLRDGRIAEGLAGVEYNGDCWVLRVVTYNVAVGTGDSSRSVFLQLELNGVAKVGSNPLEVLRQNISGYTKINEPQTSVLPPLR